MTWLDPIRFSDTSDYRGFGVSHMIYSSATRNLVWGLIIWCRRTTSQYSNDQICSSSNDRIIERKYYKHRNTWFTFCSNSTNIRTRFDPTRIPNNLATALWKRRKIRKEKSTNNTAKEEREPSPTSRNSNNIPPKWATPTKENRTFLLYSYSRSLHHLENANSIKQTKQRPPQLPRPKDLCPEINHDRYLW